MRTVLLALLLSVTLSAQDAKPKALTAEQQIRALTLSLEDARDRVVLLQLQSRASLRELGWKELEAQAGCPVNRQTVTLTCLKEQHQ